MRLTPRALRRMTAWGATAAVFGLASVPAQAQGVEETRVLREAAARQAQGDYDGAEQLLRQLLEVRPASSGGLFALERVLRAKGNVLDILPAVDTFLAHDASASGVRTLKLRVLSDADSTAAVEREGEAWLQAQPTSDASYREVARAFSRSFGPERAIQVLERGRKAMARSGAFALDMGDLQAAAGHVDQAVDEWVTAVGDDGGQARTVGRRVQELKDPREAVARRLVRALGAASEPGRRRAGAQIALDLGLGGDALTLSRKVAADLQGRARMAFLSDVARRARDAELTEVASWAYGELGQDAASPGERRQFDQRLVELSLADGDTATALEAQRRVVDSFTPGSADQRRATVGLIGLEASSAETARLRTMLDTFRTDFPDAPELDEVTATVAGALLARGDVDGATDVLEGSGGPKSSLQRGYLRLAAGDVDGAKRSLLMSLPGLTPAEATSVIQFVSLLGRLSPQGAQALADAEALAHEGKGLEAAQGLEDAVEGLPEKERPSLLAEAARMAERGGAHPEAADLRAGLIEAYPDAPESADAMLALARYRAERPDGRAEAIRLLEALVTTRPNAPMVPDARRELDRLRRGGA